MSPTGDHDAALALLRDRIPGLVAVYRYGSSGTPAERPESDIDLAILTDPPLSRGERVHARWDVAQAVAEALGREVDLVDLGAASTVFRARVVTGGERVWCADRAAAERFEDHALSAYARLNEERAGILRDIRERGRIHGR